MMKKSRLHRFYFGGLFFSAVLVTACAGSPLPLAHSFSSIEPNETIVVGKIVLSPPLQDGEQSMKTVSALRSSILINPHARKYRNKIILLTNDEKRQIGEPSLKDYRGRIEAELGETFYVTAQNRPLYILGGEIFMSVKEYGLNKARLPGIYKIDIRPNDKAVYIGTIIYHRDEFFDITQIELIDDYKTEKVAFEKRFNTKGKLRKALILPQ